MQEPESPVAPRPFHRLAIVNRGEPAMRAIHAVRELNDGCTEPLRVIALHTDLEPAAMFVREADEAVCIGPATSVGADGARRSGYLDLAALERALVSSEADAVWVGWGFVAEQPAFVDLCDRLDIVFVGPTAKVMRLLGDKINSKLLAEDAGVPVAPWSRGPVDTLDEARRHADTIGFPLMIKATAGGGGRGIRRVDDLDGLEAAFTSARAEGASAFGDPTVFLEQLVWPARHVEVQVIADGTGRAWAVGVRDCSLQRRNQKVVEESACIAFTPEQDRFLRDVATRLVVQAGYRNAATVEFLYRPEDGTISFLEVNARLQVEHTVTELTTGLDLVKLQLHIAAGGTLEGDPPPTFGHAIEVRLNAEDPARNFLPAPGLIELLRLPHGPGIRVDTGVAEGDVIPGAFDSMIAKVMAWGRTRDEALARLRRALADTVVVVRDGTTNQAFLLDLLDRPAVRSGDVDNTWLDREHEAASFVPTRHAWPALIQAAIEVTHADDRVEQTRFYGWARRGRPQTTTDVGSVVELRLAGVTYRLRVWRCGPQQWQVEVDGTRVDAEVERLGRHQRRLRLGGRVHRVVSTRQGGDLLIDVDGVSHRLSRDDGGLVRSPAPAVVVAVSVQVDDVVAAGDVVAVVESMKMETALTAPFAGRVRRILTGTNVQVDTGTPLLQIEPASAGADDPTATRLVLDPSTAAPELAPVERSAAAFDRVRALLLGYDVPDDEVGVLCDAHGPLWSQVPVDEPAVLAAEHGVLLLFADLLALTRPRDDGADAGESGRSAHEHLHAYLRSLDPAAEGLPPRYVDQLERVVAAHGVAGLDRSPALEEAMYRVFRALERHDAHREVVIAVLRRRLEQADELIPAVTGANDFREALDRVIAATLMRDATIADLAREVRRRYYDQPLLDAARDATYAEMDGHLAALAVDPDAPDREDHLGPLVACPRSLAPLLTVRCRHAPPAERRALLEVITRRYYRMRSLSAFAAERIDGVELVVSRYEHEGYRCHVVIAFAEADQLVATAAAAAAYAAGVPGEDIVLLDLYGPHEPPVEPDEPDAVARRALDALALVELPRQVRRVVVGVAHDDPGPGRASGHVFTFRPADRPVSGERVSGEPVSGDGLLTTDLLDRALPGDHPVGPLVEDPSLRDLHPMMALRLNHWRLASFDLHRLPSAQDVNLYHGVARDNPRDERLFALAEVRDFTAVRDEDGRVVALPELELVLGRALDGIRQFQAQRRGDQRLQWNRIGLHVWERIDLDLHEVRRVASRLAPATAGLGIEMVTVRGQFADPVDGAVRDRVLRISSPSGSGMVIELDEKPTEPLRPLDEYTQKVVQARRRGTVYPYELIQTLAPAIGSAGIPPGDFVEHDLDADGRLVPVDRPRGRNVAGIVVGVVRNVTSRYPEGMTRVALFGDPTRALGSIAEPECRRIIAALDLAASMQVPVDWFALSAGAKIAMDSGTENMDWISAVLRRIIEHTQRGGEVNVVVAGINVGAQPYWNAEATMLMHTKGILVMTPASAMVLTGKQALDYSGGVSAEDNHGIGGFERIMGPNGQAQYWAPDLAGACRVLLAHHDHAYVAPGERFPRRATTSDPLDRDAGASPHDVEGSDFTTVADIFSATANPDRKKPFDIRTVMAAVADADHRPLERWAAMRGASTAVAWDTHLGGWPVSMIGIESRALPRHGAVPADGPEVWTSGTLFPGSSWKVARAINAASGNRPVVVLANLSGFDGSPESMRRLQLEFGAEIGRAVVNFDGPMVFCVISRFHGGAFVVFSRRLNDDLVSVAVEGSRASVIGGAPAAAVVFAAEVDRRTAADPRIAGLDAHLRAASDQERERIRLDLAALRPVVRSEKLGELAAEFDQVHSIERALAVGSIEAIIPAPTLRPFLIDAVTRGIARTESRPRR